MTVQAVLPAPLSSAVPHPSGTEVRLLGLATALPPHRLRQTDVVARYGGEEFAVVLSNTDGPNAFTVIDRLRSQFAALVHESDKGESFSTTFSAGVTAFAGQSTAREMVLSADRALYQAKDDGRDRVMLSS